MITDGLDRDKGIDLANEMRKIHLSSRRFIWLNPLLRWDQFAAKATGIRIVLPHVDCFLSGHSIESLEALAKIISECDDEGKNQEFCVLVLNLI